MMNAPPALFKANLKLKMQMLHQKCKYYVNSDCSYFGFQGKSILPAAVELIKPVM